MKSTINVKGQLGREFPIPIKAITIPDKLLPPNTLIEVGLFIVIGVDGSIEVKFGIDAQMSCGIKGSMPLVPLHPTLNVTNSTPVIEFEAAVNGKIVLRLQAHIVILNLDLIELKVDVIGIGITAKLEPIICPNLHVSVHLVSELKAALGSWDVLEIKFLDEKNSPSWDFYFDTIARRFNIGKCPCPHGGVGSRAIIPLNTAAPSFEKCGSHMGERDSVQMGGDVYSDAIIYGVGPNSNATGRCFSRHNLSGQFRMLTGYVGRVDGSAMSNLTINIIGDGNILFTRALVAQDLPLPISISVEGVNVLEIEFRNVERIDRTFYAVQLFLEQIEGQMPPQVTTNRETSLNVLASSFERCGSHMGERNSVQMGGFEYRDVVIYGVGPNANSRCFSRHNLRGQYQFLTGYVGRIDGQAMSNATLNIIGDGNVLFTRELVAWSLPIPISISVQGINVLEIELRTAERVERTFYAVQLFLE
jgi:hypothetical protein